MAKASERDHKRGWTLFLVSVCALDVAALEAAVVDILEAVEALQQQLCAGRPELGQTSVQPSPMKSWPSQSQLPSVLSDGSKQVTFCRNAMVLDISLDLIFKSLSSEV